MPEGAQLAAPSPAPGPLGMRLALNLSADYDAREAGLP